MRSCCRARRVKPPGRGLSDPAGRKLRTPVSSPTPSGGREPGARGPGPSEARDPAWCGRAHRPGLGRCGDPSGPSPTCANVPLRRPRDHSASCPIPVRRSDLCFLCFPCGDAGIFQNAFVWRLMDSVPQFPAVLCFCNVLLHTVVLNGPWRRGVCAFPVWGQTTGVPVWVISVHFLAV